MEAGKDEFKAKLEELERRLEKLEREQERQPQPASQPGELAEIRRQLDILATEVELLRSGETGA